MCPPIAPLPNPGPQSQPATIPPWVPTDEISQAAYQKARRDLHQSVLNHSIRVYLYAKLLSEGSASNWHQADRLPLLFTACLFHDMGTSHAHDGSQRFEVEGGDAASNFLSEHGVSAAEAHEVWTAIALHTSPGIAERITVLSRLVRVAIETDFHRHAGAVKKSIDEGTIEATEKEFPRMEIELVLGNAVVEQALRDPAKAPRSTWPGGMLRYRIDHPDAEGINGEF